MLLRDGIVRRIEAALDKAKHAKAKPARSTAEQIADEAVAKAFARHGIELHDEVSDDGCT